jgi:surface antigen
MRRSGSIIVIGLLSLGTALGPSGAGCAWAETRLCTGYAACRAAGYSDFGYEANAATEYWQMVAGHNCTNYVAYRLVRAGLPNVRPVPDAGRSNARLSAYQWGVVYASRTDDRPAAGAVAWWDTDAGKGTIGHVAYVESRNPDGSITISEDSSSGHDFDWKIVAPGRGWPSGFVHFTDATDRPGRVPDRAPDRAPGYAPDRVPAAPNFAPQAPRPVSRSPWAVPRTPRHAPRTQRPTRHVPRGIPTSRDLPCSGAMAAAARPPSGARP